MMKLISINVSKPKPIEYGGKTIHTGIFKQPISGTVMLREMNIDGDGQGDLKVHGGTYKAIYGYPIEHYKHWQQELNRHDLTYGQFGENLTVERHAGRRDQHRRCLSDRHNSAASNHTTASSVFQIGIQNGIT